MAAVFPAYKILPYIEHTEHPLDFGYSIPRTSYEQRSCGTGVDYSSAQPGDLICYDGHVAMYIGGGLIVHASTQRTGIKVSNANYRPILAVRRIV